MDTTRGAGITARHRSAEDRFDALWQEHSAAVVRYARRRVLPGEVDEVVAETFLVAWRRIDDVPQVALPWLLGVARGVSANVRRAARRRHALIDRLAARPDDLARAEGVDGALGSGSVAAALARLREADRELLTLLAWDGLDNAQAAATLGCSRGTFAVRLHRARRRLQAELDRAGLTGDHQVELVPDLQTARSGR